MLQAPSPYRFWSTLANRDPGVCDMTLATTLMKKANGPKANTDKTFMRKRSLKLQPVSIQPYVHCHSHLHLSCLY